MSENKADITFGGFLGNEFQEKLFWQLLVDYDFCERVVPKLNVDYFDNQILMRLFIIMLEYHKKYEKYPNLPNKSIYDAVNQFKTPNNILEEEALFSIINRIFLWNERVLNNDLIYDGDVVQQSTFGFITQQEYRKLAEHILLLVRNGKIKDNKSIGEIESRIREIQEIGNNEDYGTLVSEDIKNALRKEFRETIPTGVLVLDDVMGGGLGKGECGFILSPSGIGKTTSLTKYANTAYELEKNVLQIIFEDTEEQVKRKHYAIWSKIPLSELTDNNDLVEKLVVDKISKSKGGRLVIKKFSQESTTMMDIRNFIIKYEKKHGIKFDMVVLDYLDCVESHKASKDRNEDEFTVVKSFLALAADFNIPCWTAIQTNRSGFESEFIEVSQTGGSIKRVQKAHFVMSIAKPGDMKQSNLANIRIHKARFAHDGQSFKDCIFNNDTLEIRITDDTYKFRKDIRRDSNRITENDIKNLDEKLNKLDVVIPENIDINSDSLSEAEKNEIKRLLDNLSPNSNFDNET